MCISDLEMLGNLIRSAMANILIDEDTEALSDLIECLKKIEAEL